MNLYFTRRDYDAASDTFTKKIADETSYVVLPQENVNAGFRTDQATWLGHLKSQMGSNDVLIFVHGFNTSQAKMLRRLRKLKKGLVLNGFRGAVTAFSWPNRERATGYLSDKNDVPKFAKSLLQDAVLPIWSMPERPNIHILCHSMGAYVFLLAFSGELPPRKLNEVAFVAADLDRPTFIENEPPPRLLQLWAKRATNYYSLQDRVLDVAENIVHGDPRLGRDGLPRPTGANLFDVACANRYLSPAYEGRRDRNYSHTWYFDDANWLKDVRLTLRGDAPGSMPTRGPSMDPPDLDLL